MLSLIKNCCLTLGCTIGLALAGQSALFATVNNATQQVLLLQQHATSMHSLVGHKVLEPGQVFIAQFDYPDKVTPYLVYSLKNARQLGRCYLKPQRSLEKPRCSGTIKAEVIYLGDNSYEFTLYET